LRDVPFQALVFCDLWTVPVDDVARLKVLALGQHTLLGVYNVGTGIETSVKCLHEALRSVAW
jgi:hypothetical protein